MLIRMSDFVEFKNTPASKAAEEKEKVSDSLLRFALTKAKNYEYISCFFNRALVNTMMKYDLEKFKMLFNQKTNEVILQFDHSTNCINIERYKLRTTGVIVINKFVTYTMLPIIKAKGVNSITYKAEYIESLKLIVCTPIK